MIDILNSVWQSLHSPIKYLSLLSVLVPLTAGLVSFKQQSGAQRIIFYYILLCCLTEIVTLISAKGNKEIFIFSQNLFTIFECCFLIIYYYLSFETVLIKRVVVIIILAYFVWATISLLQNGVTFSNNYITTIESCLLMTCSIFYIMSSGLITRDTRVLWVSFAVLIYFATNFITFKYEKEIDADLLLRRNIYSLQRIVNIFYNVVFSFALTLKKIE